MNAGRRSSFEQRSQSTEGRASLNRYYYFHGHSGMHAWLAFYFLLLCFLSQPVSPLIPAPRSLFQNPLLRRSHHRPYGTLVPSPLTFLLVGVVLVLTYPLPFRTSRARHALSDELKDSVAPYFVASQRLFGGGQVEIGGIAIQIPKFRRLGVIFYLIRHSRNCEHKARCKTTGARFESTSFFN